MAKKKFYAVKTGKTPGIYTTWSETEAQVKGFPGARYKGFATRDEAKSWLADETVGQVKSSKSRKVQPRSKALPKVDPEKEIVVYTDGGAINNPGPGGYGAVLLVNGKKQELSGGFKLTTNNRMELFACIAALRKLGKPDKPVALFSDSSYVVNGISKGWAVNWRKNGWLKSDKKPVLNQDLWEELLTLVESIKIKFHWVKGHAGNPMNERCDFLAVQSARGTNLKVDKGYSP